MHKTDIAIRISTLTANRSFADNVSMLGTIERDILPSIQSSDPKIINFHGASGTGKSRLAAYCASSSNWPIYTPQKKAAPLQRLIHGQGIELTYDLITHLSTSQEIIVIDAFDAVKSKKDILEACREAIGQFILITRDEMPSISLLEANIDRYLSVEFSSATELPVITERRLSTLKEESYA